MQKYFEKIIERLEDTKGIAFLTLANTGDKMKDVVYDEVLVYMNTAIEIVNQVAEEYSSSEKPNKSDGWIPCSEKKPDEDSYCYITYEWEDGTLHVCEDTFTSHGWEDTVTSAVIAWKYVDMPAPYQPKGE